MNQVRLVNQVRLGIEDEWIRCIEGMKCMWIKGMEHACQRSGYEDIVPKVLASTPLIW
jgi:hypothetical protein